MPGPLQTGPRRHGVGVRDFLYGYIAILDMGCWISVNIYVYIYTHPSREIVINRECNCFSTWLVGRWLYLM